MIGAKKPLYSNLYFQVIISMAIGIVLGLTYPSLGVEVKPLGDCFIKLMKMIVGPIIFISVVIGIAKMGDMANLGRIGFRALVYFEVVSTIALIFGLCMSILLQPGVGLNIDAGTIDSIDFLVSVPVDENTNIMKGILKFIPTSVIQPFVDGNTLQILFLAILTGVALVNCGKKNTLLVNFLDQGAASLFGIINIIMRVAPIGAFGAIAYTVGKYGFVALVKLSTLVCCFFASNILFIFIILGCISKLLNINIWHLIKYIKSEIILVVSTGSSESAMPNLMDKLEKLGCNKKIVGLVVPTGYSFNLDGTSLYLTMAIIFLAQAFSVELSLFDLLLITGTFFFTSKGTAAVSGGGFIILISTLSGLNIIPIEYAAILFGVDRFMNDIRSVTNIIGNAVATVAIAKWESAFDESKALKILGSKVVSQTIS